MNIIQCLNLQQRHSWEATISQNPIWKIISFMSMANWWTFCITKLNSILLWLSIILHTPTQPSTSSLPQIPIKKLKSFVQIMEKKVNFALGDAPADADDLAGFTCRKKALLFPLLWGLRAKWYENILRLPSLHNYFVNSSFKARFFDWLKNFRHRIEVRHCVRDDGGAIRVFLHLIKHIFVKRWPDDMKKNAESDRDTEKPAHGRQRR